MRKVLTSILVALLLLTVPLTTAFAKGPDKTDVSCTVVLAITVAGDHDFKGKKLERLIVGDQQVEGYLDCDLDELDGAISITQGANVKVDTSTGNIEGKVQGSFVTSSGLSGRIKADITGNLVTLTESITGDWVTDGRGKTGQGNFSVSLAFDPSVGTLVGGGVLGGYVRVN